MATDHEIAIQRLTRLSIDPRTPKAVSGDLALLLASAATLATAEQQLAEARDALQDAVDSGGGHANSGCTRGACYCWQKNARAFLAAHGATQAEKGRQ